MRSLVTYLVQGRVRNFTRNGEVPAHVLVKQVLRFCLKDNTKGEGMGYNDIGVKPGRTLRYRRQVPVAFGTMVTVPLSKKVSRAKTVLFFRV